MAYKSVSLGLSLELYLTLLKYYISVSLWGRKQRKQSLEKTHTRPLSPQHFLRKCLYRHLFESWLKSLLQHEKQMFANEFWHPTFLTIKMFTGIFPRLPSHKSQTIL